MPGRYYEELHIGEIIEHPRGRTITEMDNILFCSLTMNTQPLHLNEDFASRTQFKRRLVNGILTLGIAVGMSVPELTEGTLIANLGYEAIKHPHPLFHGDTLYVSTEILDKRPSRSQPDRGIVRFRHTGRNQERTVVLEVERLALMRMRAKAEESSKDAPSPGVSKEKEGGGS